MRIFNLAFKIGQYMMFGTLVVCIIVWRLENIDMSETRLLITYWRNFAILFGAIILLSLGERFTDKK